MKDMFGCQIFDNMEYLRRKKEQGYHGNVHTYKGI